MNSTTAALIEQECLLKGNTFLTSNVITGDPLTAICTPSYMQEFLNLLKTNDSSTSTSSTSPSSLKGSSSSSKSLVSYFIFVNLCKGDLIIIFLVMLHIWTLRQNGFFRWARYSKDNSDTLYKASGPCVATLTRDELNQLRRCFISFDHEENGYIKTNDFVYAMVNLGYTPKKGDIEAMVSEIDVNSDGKLDFNEFLSAMTPMIAALRLGRDFESFDEERLVAAFEDKQDEERTIDVEEAIHVVLILDDKIDEKLIRGFFTNGDLELTLRNRVTWSSLEERIHTIFIPNYSEKILLSFVEYEKMFEIFQAIVREDGSSEDHFLARERIHYMLMEVAKVDKRFAFRNGLLKRKLREDITKGDVFSFKAVLRVLDCEWDEEAFSRRGMCSMVFLPCNKIGQILKFLYKKISHRISKILNVREK